MGGCDVEFAFKALVSDVVFAFAPVGCDYPLTDTRLIDGCVIF